MELVLDRHVADKRIFPAIDLNRSGTRQQDLLLSETETARLHSAARKEALLLSETELARIYLLRNFLSDMPPAEAIEFLLSRMKKVKTNQEFLDSMARDR